MICIIIKIIASTRSCVLDVNCKSTFGALFHVLSTGECESAEGFQLEIAYADLSLAVAYPYHNQENSSLYLCQSKFKTPLNLESFSSLCYGAVTPQLLRQYVLPIDLSPEAKGDHLLSRVFVRQNLSRNTRIKTPFFSSAHLPNVFILQT